MVSAKEMHKSGACTESTHNDNHATNINSSSNALANGSESHPNGIKTSVRRKSESHLSEEPRDPRDAEAIPPAPKFTGSNAPNRLIDFDGLSWPSEYGPLATRERSLKRNYRYWNQRETRGYARAG